MTGQEPQLDRQRPDLPDDGLSPAIGHLVIRADASEQIGAGHIMRCIALGQAWRDKGDEVAFVSHCESVALKNRIVEEGFGFIGVTTPHPDSSDVEHTLKVLADSGDETWLVLDGYHFDPAYQKRIRDAGYRLLVIDDMNHLPFYHADILLNQNIYASDLQYECDKDMIQLLGSKYILLRREFLESRQKQKKASENAKNVLLTVGGADPHNMTVKIIETLDALNKPELVVKVVVGPANLNLESIKKKLCYVNFQYQVVYGAPDMPSLMDWADLAISAAGSTCWELAYFGVPALLFDVADNQRGLADGLEAIGFSINLGWHSDINSETFADQFDRLQKNRQKRKQMANAGYRLVDGNGASRVLATMLKSPFYIRKARMADAGLLFNWRNSTEVRASAFSEDKIVWVDHLRWLKGKIASATSDIFIAISISEEPIGQIRFDKKNIKTAEIDITVAPEFRNLGYGELLLKESIADYFLMKKEVYEVNSLIKCDNSASIRVFEKAGFHKVGEEIYSGYKVIRFTKNREG